MDVIREPYAAANVPTGSGTEILPYGIQMVQANRVLSSDAGSVKVCIIDAGCSHSPVE